jgi:hypothetical protein
LHEGPPPKIHSLSTDDAAALSKDNALKLLKSDLHDKNPADFADIDGDDAVETLSNTVKEKLEKAASSIPGNGTGTEVYYGNMKDSSSSNNNTPQNLTNTRQIRKISKTPSFTIVEVQSSKSSSTKS